VAQITSSSFAVTARGFNGPAASKLLVLTDGRSVYTPYHSGVSWDIQDVLPEETTSAPLQLARPVSNRAAASSSKCKVGSDCPNQGHNPVSISVIRVLSRFPKGQTLCSAPGYAIELDSSRSCGCVISPYN
jgi:hypothetical protein